MMFIAVCQTSASRHPPPTVPIVLPSSRTSILASPLMGAEPFLDTTVAMAPRVPFSFNSDISLKTSLLISDWSFSRPRVRRRIYRSVDFSPFMEPDAPPGGRTEGML